MGIVPVDNGMIDRMKKERDFKNFILLFLQLVYNNNNNWVNPEIIIVKI